MENERRTTDRRRAPTGPHKGDRSGEERRVSPAIGDFAIQDSARLRKREAILLVALRFYADASNWQVNDEASGEELALDDPGLDVSCPITEDAGDKARVAILLAEQVT